MKRQKPITYKPRRYLARRKPYPTAQAALIAVLLDFNGGAQPLAIQLGVRSSRVLEWRHRGSVPLKFCPQVAAFYKIAPELLNYKD